MAITANSEKRNAGADIRLILRAPAFAWCIDPRRCNPPQMALSEERQRRVQKFWISLQFHVIRRLSDVRGSNPQANRVNQQSKAMPRPAAWSPPRARRLPAPPPRERDRGR